MKTKCIQCSKEFEAERASAKFCSEPCKKKFQRNLQMGVFQSHKEPEELNEILSEGRTETADQTIRAVESKSQEPLTTGRATPGLHYDGWARPRYWQRLRDLLPEEAEAFHAWLKQTGRACPVDPTLPTAEQDFYHPWAYTEWKNPPEGETGPKAKEPIVPLVIPKNESPDQLKERLGRIKSYNETMEPRHHLTEAKLKAMLKKSGYSPGLANHVFPRPKKLQDSIPE